LSGAPLVTLLTDFGTADAYVAEMKAAMLGIDPTIRFVDITHDLSLGDVSSATYLLARSWQRFPEGTVHLVVVDPGVGTARRALAATCAGRGFVAPDNGLLSPVLDEAQVVALAVADEAAPTFHGRDVFAPAAARLASGTPLAELGEVFTGWHRIPLPKPRATAGRMLGAVVYVDRFGTLVTNLSAPATDEGWNVTVGTAPVGPVRRTFADVESGALLAFVGSNGTIEIAVRDGSAASVLEVRTGAQVNLTPASSEPVHHR